jgi:outer membrane protein assembly factor BamB/tetratricopeptide (TPR) repeat protein
MEADRRLIDPSKAGPRRKRLAIAMALVAVMSGRSIAADLKRGPARLFLVNETVSENPEQIAQNVFSRPDRNLLLRLSKAQQLVGQSRYAEAVGHLGAVLESSEDYFLPAEGALRRSLRVEAQRLLGEMPKQGRELYELEYGARARRMLNEASAAGDVLGLAEVARHFFHTQAGYEATLLLGLYHLDHGSPLAGAMALARLQDVAPERDDFEPALSLSLATCWLRSGMPEKAVQTLLRLKRRHAEPTVDIGGRSVPLFADDAGALDWLTKWTGVQGPDPVEGAEQWCLTRGNAARNRSVTGSGPLLSLRWRVPTTEHPTVEAKIEELSQSPREQDRGAIPTSQPLVVGNTVLMRSTDNLLAVDVTTGKRIWEVPGDDPFEGLMGPPAEGPFPFPQPLNFDTALKYRLWGDATYGTLSSDGQRVYAVEDLGVDVGAGAARQFLNMQAPRNALGAKSFNRLAAFDVRTGKLQWELGGALEEFGLSQAGAFFLGPPLPLAGRLYAIAEYKQEIRLLALDPKKGTVLWKQQLAVADREVVSDPVRRLSGVSPSYADGILVCPTGNSSIVALELSTRSLMWGYVYPDRDAQSSSQAMFPPGFRPPSDAEPASRWVDGTLILAEGCVLATPPDSEKVHCLRLVDGKLLWTQPRDEDLYLACVYQGRAILVGQRRVRALALPTGEPAWGGRVAAFSGTSTPSGTGVLCGDRYYVPLSSGEVAAVDLKDARIVHTSRSRQGLVPGNLVCAGDKVVSQRPGAVEVFYQWDQLGQQVARRLAANPRDADALALAGEMRWDEGKLGEAIADFRRSLEAADDPRARGLLRDALFEGLRTDFAVHRRSAGEIERLLEDAPQRATFYWLMAHGSTDAREYRTAFGYYAQLIDLDQTLHELERVDPLLSVRRDRWIRVQLAALRDSCPAEVRAEIDRQVERRLQAAAGEKGSEALARFLDYFGGLPAADRAAAQLIAAYRRSDRPLAAEFLLRRQERPEDSRRTAAAVAQLAELLAGRKSYADAACCYRRLEREFAGVACGDGKTGRQWRDALPAGSPIRPLLAAESPWPAGEVVVKRARTRQPPPETYSRFALEYSGCPSPFFSDVTLEMQLATQTVTARDGAGGFRWQLPLAELLRRGSVPSLPYNRGVTRAAVRGHLLVLSAGPSIVGLDTLGVAPGHCPRVLWKQDADEGRTDGSPRPRMRFRAANLALVQQQRAAMGFPFQSSGLGNPAAAAVLLSDEVLCFSRFHNCVAVHPLTGDTLWVRKGVHPESAIFGDDQYVFLVPPDGGAATVLRTADGKFLGQREVAGERLATEGRHVLTVNGAGTRTVLELVDPWDAHKVWSRPFSADAKFKLVDSQWVGAVEPSGRFVLLEIAGGQTVVDAKIEPEEKGLGEVFVLRYPDGFVLVTDGLSRDKPPERRVYSLHGMPSAQISRGRVYAFDGQGKPRWAHPVIVEDQFLLLSQPRGLPVVTFACTAQAERPDVSPLHAVSVLCLDRNTGRVILREESPGISNTFLLTGDLRQKTVQLQLQRETVTMTFTGRPVVRPESDGRTSRAKVRKTLFDTMKDAAQRTWDKIRGGGEEETEPGE